MHVVFSHEFARPWGISGNLKSIREILFKLNVILLQNQIGIDKIPEH